MKINGQKTKEMVINFVRSSEHIHTLEIGREKIEKVSHTKLLGVTICDNLSWDAHISSITAKACQRAVLPENSQKCKNLYGQISILLFGTASSRICLPSMAWQAFQGTK